MIRALYSGATGMDAQQTAIDVTANNLANVNTAGFKRSRANFQDLLYQVESAPGLATSATTDTPGGLQVGLGVRVAGTQRLFTQGTFRDTGAETDMVIQGKGFFQVQLPDGTVGYTRDGAFSPNQEGVLVNASGYALEPPITVTQEMTNIQVGQDGTVTAQVAGQDAPTELGQIQLAQFSNPNGLLAQGGNIFVPTQASGPAIVGVPGEAGMGSLRAGYLEGANVTVVEEMIELISAQRAFEFNSKTVQAADQMLQAVGRLR